VLAALLPLLLVPLVLALVRERGTEPAPAAGATAAGPASLAALGSREFLLLALIAFCTFYSLVAVTTHLFLYFKDRGFADATAAASLTVMYLTGICGKLGAGALADVVGVKRAFAALLVVMFGGVMLLAASLGETVWLAVAMTGLGWGGVYTLQQLVATELFAGPSLGRIVGTLVLIDSVGGALGPAVTGWLYDLHGSYDFALRAILVLLLLAGVTLAFLRVPNPRGRAS
jgi:MFS family permease